MYRCEFWCGHEEMAVDHLSSLPPIGYTVRLATDYSQVYVVEGGELFLDDHGDGDVVAAVYLREVPKG